MLVIVYQYVKPLFWPIIGHYQGLTMHGHVSLQYGQVERTRFAEIEARIVYDELLLSYT